MKANNPIGIFDSGIGGLTLAHAAAYELAKEYVGSKAKVISVIDPVINYIEAHYPHKSVGLIGTKKTVKSNVFESLFYIANYRAESLLPLK